jgi:hypothetical protein
LYQLGYTDVVGKLMAVAQEIVQRYTIARESTVVLAAAYGVTPRAIRLLLERNGVKCRSRSEAKVTLPHWTSAFATQTPERDYWCGFLFADGHIARERSSSPKLAVNLSVRDWEHLVRLRRYLCADHAIVRIRKQTGDGCILSVRCREIVDDLERLGMCMSPDRVAADELARSRDFWRGVVDGDGHIGFRERYAHVELAGWEPLVAQFVSFLRASGVRTRATLHLYQFLEHSSSEQQ